MFCEPDLGAQPTPLSRTFHSHGQLRRRALRIPAGRIRERQHRAWDVQLRLSSTTAPVISDVALGERDEGGN